MKKVKIDDREFEISISKEQIQKNIENVALQINNDFKNREVIFVGILCGAFMFASDLYKKIDLKSKITFIKVASYQGTQSTGVVKNIIGLTEDIKGKCVILIEDIVDTGLTLERILGELKEMQPAEIKIATLVLKPDAFKKDFKIDYVGMKIPNDFIVGYGLDYNGYGRNLEDIYVVC